ncbi:unnamed protein product [Meloidogyne enterolobii]|uniref:Uncharacterized protein n=1 Tax=Meloidogyne enterolobii TaxID=390850 RepID=A0ACB1A4I1_MELEN
MTVNIMYTWKLDLGGGAGSRSLIKLAASDQTINPPGYHQGFIVSQQVETVSKNEQQQQHLLNKRAWDVALGPLKALPMNMFMMYMAGNTISIFPIMMVMMMVWRPIKTLLSVNATFKVMEQEYGSSLILHKIVFILGNLGAVALAVYKCHTMGLLPNHESDWLDFMSEPERLQLSLSFDIDVPVPPFKCVSNGWRFELFYREYFLGYFYKKLYAIYLKKLAAQSISDNFIYVSMCGSGTTKVISLGFKNNIKVSKGHHRGHEINNERAILNALHLEQSHGSFFLYICTWKYGNY